MPYSKVVHVPFEATQWPIHREWSRLEDLSEGIFDYPHSTPILTATGPYVARSQDIRTGVFLLDEAAHVSEETYKERISRAEPNHGDLLYSREGTYFGIAAEVPPDLRVCLGQRMVLIRPKQKLLNSRFLRFWLNSPLLARHLHGFRDGTVAERLNMPTIRALPVPMFDPDEQEAISSLLGAIDDKIKITRYQNQTLEAMARKVFKDWFIDFGPTRAKVEGLPPYLVPDLWSLFPATIDADDKPVLWERVSVRDLVEFNPTERIEAGKLSAYLDMSALPTTGSWPDMPTDRPFAAGSKFRNGDALLARITPCLENGKAAFIQCLEQDDVGWGSTEFIVMRARAPLPAPFAYILARDPDFRERAIRSMTGTSGRQRVQVDTLSEFPLCKPSDAVSRAFGKIVSPWFDKIAMNAGEAHSLAALQDLLLPKLLSGEIRLRDAEKEVEERL